jgi:hypothetical protein
VVEPDSGGEDDTGSAPVTMADNKETIAQAAVDAGFFATLDDAMTWTKSELLELWEEGP